MHNACLLNPIKTLTSLKLLLGFVVCVFFNATAHAEPSLTVSQAKAALLYNFIKHTRWPNEKAKSDFKVGFFNASSPLFKAFSGIASEVVVRGKKVKLYTLTNKSVAASMDVVVVPASMNLQLEEFTTSLVSSETLIVSDNAKNDRVVMVNFIQSAKQRISFQINRSNIVYEGLSISNDVLIHGGTEIEVAKLYKQMESSLKNIKDQVLNQKTSLRSLQNQLREKQAALARQLRRIETQQEKLDDQKASIEAQKQNIQQLTQDIEGARSLLAQKNQLIDKREQKLSRLAFELKEKRNQFEQSQQALKASQQLLEQQQSSVESLAKEISDNEAILDLQMLKLADQEQELDKKTLRVSEQQQTITWQRNLIAGVLFLVLIVTILIIIRQRQALERERKLLKAEARIVEVQQESIQAFESSIQLKNDFLTAINHELRTPMNGILGALELARSEDTKSVQGSIDMIGQSAGEMMNLVDDILTYTEIQSEQAASNPQPFELWEFLQKQHDRFSRLSKDKGLILNWQQSSDLPKTIALDHKKLAKILDKVIDNAIKFTDKGTVSVFIKACFLTQESGEEQPCLKITIADTGPGISEEFLAELGVGFMQDDSGLSRKHSGLGIGLAISRSYCNVMRGNLTIENLQPQKQLLDENDAQFAIKLAASSHLSGCKVSIELPFEASIAQHSGQSVTDYTHCDQPSLSPQVSGPVLVVEDNQVNQKIMQKMLQRIGYKSIVVSNGEEALKFLEHTKPALIFMDLQMPVMDGFDCTRIIRSKVDELGRIPIIALTANLIDSQQHSCLEAGMDAYLGKPITLPVLENTMKRYFMSGQ